MQFGVTMVMLNDKDRTIFNLKYRKGFLILVLGKRMEILYYFKPFDTKIIIRQVDYFLGIRRFRPLSSSPLRVRPLP